MRTAVAVLLLAGGLLALLGLRAAGQAPRRAETAGAVAAVPRAAAAGDPLLAALRSADPDVRLQAALRLDERHLPALVAMLRDGPDRVLAARTLRRLKAAGAADTWTGAAGAVRFSRSRSASLPRGPRRLGATPGSCGSPASP